MIKNLVILESPSKAKTVGKILGKDYTVIASKGHLRDLPTSKLGVDIENDFEPQYFNMRKKLDTILDIKNLAKESKNIFLASDPDREGEAIAWHLAQILGIDPKTAKRVTFNEITEKGIEIGIKSPRGIDMELVNAYQARRVLDRLVGYQISPLLWKKIKKGLSAGRVQSVAVRLICDREEEIEAFKSKEYWTINASLLKSDTVKPFNALFFGKNGKKIVPETEADCDKVLKDIGNKTFVVTDVKPSSKKQTPYAPFTTSSLQQDAAHKLNFRTSKTMQIAQKLYEGVDLGNLGTMGLITYIRTDSVRIADDATIAAREYIKKTFGADYLTKTKRVFKNKSQAQDAHEAIRPTHIELNPETVKSKLEPDEYKLYKLIYDRFIASQMSDAQYDIVSVTVKAGDYEFKASGRRVKFKGFTAQYDPGTQIDENDGDFNKVLPKLSAGDELKLCELGKKQHFTQPPARYNEASLVKMLEDLGIGRPSTYATIISTIQEREYVARDKKSLYPTETGKVVNGVMKSNFPDIVDATFTAGVETKLDDIAQGQTEWKNVIRDFYGPFSDMLANAEKEVVKLKVPDKESDVACPKCGKTMIVKNGKFGEFLACPDYPRCKSTKSIDVKVGKNCPKCGRELLYKHSKDGRKFIACSGFPECTFSSLYEPTGNMCPVCGEFLVYKRGKKYKYISCSNKNCGYTPSKSKKEESEEK